MNETKPPEYDPARLLTYFSLLLVFFVFLYLAGVVGWQLYKTNEVETGTWGQLCLVIGWALSKAADVYGNRFQTTMQSKAKDDTISQQARTAAATTDALLDPSVIVTRSDKPKQSAILPDAPAVQPTDEKKP